MIKCYISEDYLEHHGVLGQKWGVRRYQNLDGTLTTEGKKRLKQDSKEFLSLARQTGYSKAGAKRGLYYGDADYKTFYRQAEKKKNKAAALLKKAEHQYYIKSNDKKALKYLEEAKKYSNEASDYNRKAQAALDLKTKSKELLEEVSEMYDIGRTYIIGTYGEKNVKKLLENSKTSTNSIFGRRDNYDIIADDDGYTLNWDLRKQSDGSYKYEPIKYK